MMLAVGQAAWRCGRLVAAAPAVRARCTAAVAGPSNLLLRQLFDGDTFTYTYLVADRSTGDAALIDPVIDCVERDVTLLRQLGLTLKYAVNTHMHADHVTGSGLLKWRLPGVQSVISAAASARADRYLQPGEVLTVGDVQLETRPTPGHTDGCVSYVLHEAGLVFSGDALLIKGCGRTDFQLGSSAGLYESVHQQIFSLPDHYAVLPAHDYLGFTSSTVGEEKQFNPRLSLSKDEFVKLMEELKLDYPQRIDEALPANKACGLQQLSPAHKQLFK